jgi:hypothetical protein
MQIVVLIVAPSGAAPGRPSNRQPGRRAAHRSRRAEAGELRLALATWTTVGVDPTGSPGGHRLQTGAVPLPGYRLGQLSVCFTSGGRSIRRSFRLVNNFLYSSSRPALRAAACGGRPRAGSHTTRAGGCRPTLGRVESNRSSGPELEGSTRRLGRLVADAIRECLERDRAELNQGEDLPP